MASNIKQEPLDIKEEYVYRSDESHGDDERGRVEVFDSIDIKEEPLRVKEERCRESNHDSTRASYGLCDICWQYFITTQELAAHRYTHTSDVTYTCLLCHRTCVSKAGLQRHFTNRHSDKKSKQVNIAAGLERPLTTRSKQVNIATNSTESKHTRITPKRYKCNRCHKKFAWKRNLKKHVRKHAAANIYECGVCRKRFRSISNLKIHMRIHTGEKPYTVIYRP